MNMTSNVDVVVRQIKAVEPSVRAATSRALNKVGGKARTMSLRLLAGATGLTLTKLRPYVVQNRATYTRLQSVIHVFSHTFNVASFGSRQTKRGVSSNAWGVHRVYPGTFLIQGGKTAMVRVGKARTPIRPVWGPRLTKEYADSKTQQPLEQLVASDFPQDLKHELDFALGRVGLGASQQ